MASGELEKKISHVVAKAWVHSLAPMVLNMLFSPPPPLALAVWPGVLARAPGAAPLANFRGGAAGTDSTNAPSMPVGYCG
jgi:hypothetical protein